MRYRRRSRASLEAELQIRVPESSVTQVIATLTDAIRGVKGWGNTDRLEMEIEQWKAAKYAADQMYGEDEWLKKWLEHESNIAQTEVNL